MLENISYTKLNNGYHILGPGPLDDRTAITSVESLFISEDAKEDCLLYNRAYDGMLISVFEEDESVSLYQLKDCSPYIPGTIETVDETNFTDFWQVMNANKINKEIKDAQYFNDANLDDNLALLTDHGNLPKGKKVSDLKNMTISQILSMILFETAVPKKTVNQSASISFKSPFTGIIEVGRELPSVEYFNYSYVPEKWNWVSKNDSTVKGDEKSLSQFSKITYYHNDSNSNEGGSTFLNGYNNIKTVEGTNGYWYGTIEYAKKDDAVDSLGRTAESEGSTKYAAAKSGSINTATINFVGAWKIYSNATMISASSLWSHRNDEINAANYKGTNPIVSDIFCEKTKSVYLLFPKQTTDAQPFYIYVPESYNVTTVAGANNVVENMFDIEKTIGTPTEVEINCSYATGNYKRYTIEKSAGNTCVKVTMTKA